VEKGKTVIRLYHGTTVDVLAQIAREGRVRGMFSIRKTGDLSGLYWSKVRKILKNKNGVVLRLLVPKSIVKTKILPVYYAAKKGRKISIRYIDAVWVYEGATRGWRQYKSISDARNRKNGIAVSM
jgi:hypothetical protein